MKFYIDLVLLAAIFFTFNIMADTKPKINDVNIECTTHTFVGGPLSAKFTIKDGLLDFKISYPVGEGKFKRPEFGEFDNLLQLNGKIEKDEYIESMAMTNIDSSQCSNATDLPRLLTCRIFKIFEQSPLILLVRNRNNTSSREIILQTESSNLFTARRVYEQASGTSIYQSMDYEVGVRFEIKLAEKVKYYPTYVKTFHGSGGCVSH